MTRLRSLLPRGMGAGLAISHSWPNNSVELTAHSVGFVGCSQRFSCGPQLTGSVAMTSHVKSWSQLFQVIMMLLSSVHRKRRSQEDPTVDHAAIRDLNLRDIDGRQIARPHEPGKLDSVASIGFDPVPGFFGTSEGATTQQRSFFLVR